MRKCFSERRLHLIGSHDCLICGRSWGDILPCAVFLEDDYHNKMIRGFCKLECIFKFINKYGTYMMYTGIYISVGFKSSGESLEHRMSFNKNTDSSLYFALVDSLGFSRGSFGFFSAGRITE